MDGAPKIKSIFCSCNIICQKVVQEGSKWHLMKLQGISIWKKYCKMCKTYIMIFHQKLAKSGTFEPFSFN